MVLALVISTSRSGLIALTSAAVIAAWAVRGRAGRRTWMLSAIAVVTMGVIGSLYVNMQPLLSRVDETIAVGAGGRPRIWKETLVVVRDFWPAGTGLGTYQDAMLVYQADKRGGFFNQAHNQYLHLLSDGGLLLTVPALFAAVAFIALLRVRLAGDCVADAMAANRRRDRDPCGGDSGHLGNGIAHAGQRRAVRHRCGRRRP